LSRSFVTSVALALAVTAAVPALPAIARTHPTPTPTATPTPPPEDPAVTAVARHEFVAWQAGVIDKNHYTPSMQAKMTDDQMAQTSKNLSSVGALEKTDWVGFYPAPPDVPGGHAYLYHMICANHSVYELLTIAPDGKIAGIAFRDTLPGV
jgi:hypothetical protein